MRLVLRAIRESAASDHPQKRSDECTVRENHGFPHLPISVSQHRRVPNAGIGNFCSLGSPSMQRSEADIPSLAR